jgi:hypothetical protein
MDALKSSRKAKDERAQRRVREALSYVLAEFLYPLWCFDLMHRPFDANARPRRPPNIPQRTVRFRIANPGVAPLPERNPQYAKHRLKKPKREKRIWILFRRTGRN